MAEETKELPVFVVHMVCPKCGWFRSEGSQAKKCSRCGCTLVPRPFTIKICPSKEETPPLSVACEKANICPAVGEKCLTVVDVPLNLGLPVGAWRTPPHRRWVDCFAWKQLLGLGFIPNLGVYHLARCPQCGCDLVKALEKNLEENKK